MQYTGKYKSPLGNILLAADEKGLTGLWFEGQKYFARCLDKEHEEKNLPVFRDAKRWLDIYFTGKEPNFKLPLHLREHPSKTKYGKSYIQSLTEKQQPTAK